MHTVSTPGKTSFLMFFFSLIFSVLFVPQNASAQYIYEPEGLNMPGAWNSWTNPPSNNLALASFTQVSGGRVTKISSGTVRWQTIFSVAASGGDLTGGSYQWLFTSGPSGSPWGNKWAGTNVSLNTLQSYSYNSGANNQITITNGKWYTMNWKDNGYANSQAIFMETSALPVTLASVSVPTGVQQSQAVTITLTTGSTASAEEKFYLRYTTDNWSTSSVVLFSMTGSSGTATIPGQAAGTTVKYYAFSSTVSGVTGNYDLYSIRVNNNSGSNYSYSVGGLSNEAEILTFTLPQQTSPAVINSAAGTVTIEVTYGTALTNLTPAIAISSGASINPASGTGQNFSTPFTYTVTAQNGTTTKLWTVTVTAVGITWANLQHPGSGTIMLNVNYDVYCQVYVPGVTGQSTPAPGMQAWIGYSTSNSNPDTWTNWISSNYFGAVGNNDEFKANLGSAITANGTYYYASRFQANGGNYIYGGYSATGGGYWNGTTNVSGTLTVTTPSIDWANLQWPAGDTIEPGQPFDVFGQVWINGMTGGPAQFPGLQAWVGYSSENTNPSTWTNWVAATYDGPSGNNDEFKANLGAVITTNGTYYYATRYRINSQDYVYGGYSATNGGFWNGTSNISGVLTVGVDINCNAYAGVLYSEPAMPRDNEAVTIYFDATKGNSALINFTDDVYAHTGVLTNLSNNPSDWRYVKTNWGVNTPETKLTRISQNLYALTINTPRTYYNVPQGETIQKMVFVFRSDSVQGNGFYLEHRNSDGSDIAAKVYDNGVHVRIDNPTVKQTILNQSTTLPVCISAIGNTNLAFYVNSNLVTQNTGTSLSYMLVMAQLQAGQNWLKAVATNGPQQARDSVEIYLRGAVTIANLPSGTKNGINYINDSTVTLVLHDPTGFKQYVYVIGEFNNWQVSDAGYMKRTPDGKRYWLTLGGIEPGEEYAYQYYIDGELKLADPYAEKILDPWNDQWIPSSHYPNLKPYPSGYTDGVVSVFETARPAYNWQITNFVPPALNNTQSDLVIYELLIRDFVETSSVAEAQEKLDYLKELGVNAIKLMPIAEFDGNESWGYSTNFFFAADKYYGTREAYKSFIDAAHQRGIAVILDIVPNHAFGLCPMVQMYFNSSMNRPSEHNPWFNQQSPHPYSVGHDFNHESGHTRQFFKDVFQYWLTEYKVDGFRIDLSKGLTQNYSGGDLGIWNSYDQSRINILNDYKAHIGWVNPNAYIILEHFSNNDEETVLANSGFLLWSGMHNNYKQVAMGWQTNSDVSWAYHGTRGWTYPNLVDYMETHDEERMMVEAMNNGNSTNPYYNIQNFSTALHHQEQGIVLFMGIPGPKMLYEFQEMGYDYSKFYGGSNTASKPPRWDYLDVPGREKLNRVVSAMAALRKTNAFRYGNFNKDFAPLGKKMWITHSSMDVVISINMGVNGFVMAPGFTKTGTWYDYFTGESFNVSDPGGHFFFYEPGDYRVFTSAPMPKPYHTLNITVVDSISGSPLPGVTVSLSNAGNRTTDINGTASFLALPKNVTVTAEKFGWLTRSKDSLISANTNLTIALPQGWDSGSGWVNLEYPGSGNIEPGEDYHVYAQVWIDGVTNQATSDSTIQAWIGYSESNTSPATWSNWVPAAYHVAVGNNDEYKANIGSLLLNEGTYYYASRFSKDNGPYAYGGFSGGDGGFWNGTTNISGVVVVEEQPQPYIGWANLQYPGSGQIEPGQNYTVYAQAWIDTITGHPTATPGLQAWIGYSVDNTNPSTWTNWIPATFNLPVGINDEFLANLGAQISANGTYYYASRFKYNDAAYVYGGYSASGGGFWDGVTNISGVLTVSTSGPTVIHWANLQWPGSGNVEAGGNFDVYGQVYVAGLTGQPTQTPGLEAWVGYSTQNTNPSTWTNWISANYNLPVGNNDEFTLNLGSHVSASGTIYYAFRYRLNNGNYYYGGFSQGGGGFWDGSGYVSGVLTVTSPAKSLSLKLFLEGLYAGSGLMNKAQGATGDQFPGNTADKLSVELIDAGTGNLVYTLSNIDLSTSGIVTSQIPSVHNGSYYIYVIHRNSITTSTANPVSFSGSTISYDFSTGISQAFGSNLKDMGDVAAVFSGDVNQDGLIDSSDMIIVDNDVSSFASGYLNSDSNGDGLVDSSDMIIIDNNNILFVTAILPF